MLSHWLQYIDKTYLNVKLSIDCDAIYIWKITNHYLKIKQRAGSISLIIFPHTLRMRRSPVIVSNSLLTRAHRFESNQVMHH